MASAPVERCGKPLGVHLGYVRTRQAPRDFRGHRHRGVAVGSRNRPSREVGDQGGDDQHGKHVDLRQSEALHHLTQDDRKYYGRGAQYQRPVVDVIAVEQGEPDATQDLHVAVAFVVHPQRVAQLSHGEQKRCGRHETDDDRLGNVAGQVAQLEQADDDLKSANQDGQHEQRLEEFLGVLRIDEGKRGENQQRYGARRSVDQVRRRSEDRGDDRHDDCRVHTEPGIHARDQRIRHGLRERNRRDGEAGNDVMPAFDQVVVQREGHLVPLCPRRRGWRR